MRGSTSCVEIELNNDGIWGWDADDCDDQENYICELPVVSKNVALNMLKVNFYVLFS